MNRKIFCALALMLAAVTVFAQTEADFNVELTNDGAGVVITKYKGRTTAVKIPATIQGMPVKQIGKPVGATTFEGPFQETSITSVAIPSGVTIIGWNAFAHCGKLTQVTLPEGLTTIYGNAFANCVALKTITLPNSVTELGDSVFAGSGLTSITLSKNITRIHEFTFKGCESLTSVVIPEGVTEIGQDAFSGCKALASLTLPSTIQDIQTRAFSFCSSLTAVTIPASVAKISFDMGAFQGCSKVNLANQAALKRLGYTGSF